MEPDIAGFVEAHNELRAKLGVDAEFITPNVLEYPEGTVLDRAGKPLDPRVEPLNEGEATVTLRVSTVFRGAAATAQDEPIGWQEESTLMLDVAAADWPAVTGAERVLVLGELYDLLPAPANDGFGTATDRVRIFAQASS